jgi:hypothetical protein
MAALAADGKRALAAPLTLTRRNYEAGWTSWIAATIRGRRRVLLTGTAMAQIQSNTPMTEAELRAGLLAVK